MNMVTSTYGVPEVIAEIALDVKGRGGYETNDSQIWHTLDPDSGGIYRYTCCAPAFIMVASMFDKLPDSEWTHSSDRIRWQGLILDAGPRARLSTLPAAPRRNRAYNLFWSVQSKATQFVQKLPATLSRGAGPP